MQLWGLWSGHEVGELYTLCKDNVKWGWRGGSVLFSQRARVESPSSLPGSCLLKLRTEAEQWVALPLGRHRQADLGSRPAWSIESSRTARAIQINPVLKNKKQTTIKDSKNKSKAKNHVKCKNRRYLPWQGTEQAGETQREPFLRGWGAWP